MFSIRGIFVNSSGTFLSRILGLFKNITVNFFFGIVDAYWGAFQIVNTFRVFVGEGAINNAFIPLYKKVKEENKNLLKYFVIKSFLFVSLLSIVFSLILFIFSKEITSLVMPGLSKEDFILASESTKIMSIVVFLISTQSFLAAIIISRENNFFTFAYAPVIANIITIIYILLFHKNGFYTLPWSVVAGSLGMLLLQIPFTIRGTKIKNDFEIKKLIKFDENTKKFILSFLSLILISVITQINSLVSRFFGSFFYGVITATTNAFILIQAPIGMFSVATSVVGLNALSEAYSKGNKEEFKSIAEKAIRILNFLIVPISIIMIVFSEDIIKLIFRDIPGIILGSEGKYGPKALKLTLEMFSIYVLSTYFLSINSLLTRLSYARNQISVPVINSIINLITNLGVNILIFLTLKNYLGIPLAFLIASIVSTSYLAIVEWQNISNKSKIFLNLITLVLISLFSSVPINILASLIKYPDTYLTSALVSTAKITLALTTFLVISAITKIPEMNSLLNRIKKR
jgi:putative peptidoglycan lipid II flippase